MLRLRALAARRVVYAMAYQARSLSVTPRVWNSAASQPAEPIKTELKTEAKQRYSFLPEGELTSTQLLASIEEFQDFLASREADAATQRRANTMANLLIQRLVRLEEVGGYKTEDLAYRVVSLAIEAGVARVFVLTPVVLMFLRRGKPQDALSFWLEGLEHLKKTGQPAAKDEREVANFSVFRMAGYLSYLRTCQLAGNKPELDTVTAILGDENLSVPRLSGYIRSRELPQDLDGYVRKQHSAIMRDLRRKELNPNDAKLWDRLKTIVLEGKFDRLDSQVQFIRNAAKESGIPLSEARLCQLMNIYANSNRVQSAVAVFGEITQQYVNPSVQSWNELLHLQSKYKDNAVDRVNSVWDLMKENGVQYDSDSYANLVKAYIELGQMDEAVRVIAEIRQSKPVPLTNKIMDSLVYALLKSKSVAQAEKTMQSLATNDGYVPTVRVFGLLIQQYGDAGEFTKASEVLDRMAQFEVKPDVSIYTIIINMMFKQARKTGRPLDTANLREIFESMKIQNIESNNYIYSTILHDLMLQPASIPAGEALFNYMKESKIRITATTYTSLISGFAKNGRMHDAKRYFDEALAQGIKANTPFYNILIEGYAKSKNVAAALAELQSMKEKKIRPNFFTFFFLLREAANAKDWDSCTKIVQEVDAANLDALGNALPGLLRRCERSGVAIPESLKEKMN